VRDPRRAYRVVDAFEDELADYTGAPFAVAVNSCTNALFLALTWERIHGIDGKWGRNVVRIPTRTYVGVLQAILNAGCEPSWWSADWEHSYLLAPTGVVDSARDLQRGISTLQGSFTCLSFHSAKQLPLGRGGAILTDDEEAAEWFRAARMDGRPPGRPFSETMFPAWHMPMSPDVAARGLDILSRWNDTNYMPAPLPHTDYPDLSLLGYPADDLTPIETETMRWH